MNLENLLTPSETAKILKTSIGTLANWRTKEIGPRFTKMPNGRIYYPDIEIKSYLEGSVDRGRIKNTKLVPLSVIMSLKAGSGINMV